MINKIIDILTDILILVLLWFLAPLLIALVSMPPIYCKTIAIFFMALILAAVIFRFTRPKLRMLQH
jgi:hypothetical protein